VFRNPALQLPQARGIALPEAAVACVGVAIVLTVHLEPQPDVLLAGEICLERRPLPRLPHYQPRAGREHNGRRNLNDDDSGPDSTQARTAARRRSPCNLQRRQDAGHNGGEDRKQSHVRHRGR
jgi:hypothetical protein